MPLSFRQFLIYTYRGPSSFLQNHPIFLTPDLTILTPQAVEDQIQPTRHHRRELAAATLLLGGGLSTALGLGAGGLGSATHLYYKLSTDLNRDLDKVADSLWHYRPR